MTSYKKPPHKYFDKEVLDLLNIDASKKHTYSFIDKAIKNVSQKEYNNIYILPDNLQKIISKKSKLFGQNMNHPFLVKNFRLTNTHIYTIVKELASDDIFIVNKNNEAIKDLIVNIDIDKLPKYLSD
jgi:hypothetical protein